MTNRGISFVASALLVLSVSVHAQSHHSVADSYRREQSIAGRQFRKVVLLRATACGKPIVIRQMKSNLFLRIAARRASPSCASLTAAKAISRIIAVTKRLSAITSHGPTRHIGSISISSFRPHWIQHGGHVRPHLHSPSPPAVTASVPRPPRRWRMAGQAFSTIRERHVFHRRRSSAEGRERRTRSHGPGDRICRPWCVAHLSRRPSAPEQRLLP